MNLYKLQFFQALKPEDLAIHTMYVLQLLAREVKICLQDPLSVM